MSLSFTPKARTYTIALYIHGRGGVVNVIPESAGEGVIVGY